MPTIAVRVPRHPVALSLLREFDGPIAAPSANPFGYLSPTLAAHVERQIGSKVDLILDGGPCEVGVESTIVDLSVEQPALLRAGAIETERIERVVGKLGVPDRSALPTRPVSSRVTTRPRARRLARRSGVGTARQRFASCWFSARVRPRGAVARCVGVGDVRGDRRESVRGDASAGRRGWTSSMPEPFPGRASACDRRSFEARRGGRTTTSARARARRASSLRAAAMPGRMGCPGYANSSVASERPSQYATIPRARAPGSRDRIESARRSREPPEARWCGRAAPVRRPHQGGENGRVSEAHESVAHAEDAPASSVAGARPSPPTRFFPCAERPPEPSRSRSQASPPGAYCTNKGGCLNGSEVEHRSSS
jgi:hypothetical protein